VCGRSSDPKTMLNLDLVTFAVILKIGDSPGDCHQSVLPDLERTSSPTTTSATTGLGSGRPGSPARSVERRAGGIAHGRYYRVLGLAGLPEQSGTYSPTQADTGLSVIGRFSS
jgi:hypothetical protein